VNNFQDAKIRKKWLNKKQKRGIPDKDRFLPGMNIEEQRIDY